MPAEPCRVPFDDPAHPGYDRWRQQMRDAELFPRHTDRDPVPNDPDEDEDMEAQP